MRARSSPIVCSVSGCLGGAWPESQPAAALRLALQYVHAAGYHRWRGHPAELSRRGSDRSLTRPASGLIFAGRESRLHSKSVR